MNLIRSNPTAIYAQGALSKVVSPPAVSGMLIHSVITIEADELEILQGDQGKKP